MWICRLVKYNAVGRKLGESTGVRHLGRLTYGEDDKGGNAVHHVLTPGEKTHGSSNNELKFTLAAVNSVYETPGDDRRNGFTSYQTPEVS